MGRGVLGKTRSILGREVWVDEVQWILAGGLVDGERVSWYYCMYVHTLATRSATTKHGADECELSLSFRDTFSRKHQVRISVPMHAITATGTHQGYV